MAMAIRLAVRPPEVSNPKLPSPKPTRSHSQVMTSSSMRAAEGPQCHTSTPWLVTCASSSPTMDDHRGGGVKYPSARGCQLLSWCGATRSRNSCSRSASGVGSSGAGAG